MRCFRCCSSVPWSAFIGGHSGSSSATPPAWRLEVDATSRSAGRTVRQRIVLRPRSRANCSRLLAQLTFGSEPILPLRAIPLAPSFPIGISQRRDLAVRRRGCRALRRRWACVPRDINATRGALILVMAVKMCVPARVVHCSWKPFFIAEGTLERERPRRRFRY